MTDYDIAGVPVASAEDKTNGGFRGVGFHALAGVEAGYNFQIGHFVAGFETAAALGEEARDSRRSVPASVAGIVIVTGVFYLLVVVAEVFGAGRPGVTGLVQQQAFFTGVSDLVREGLEPAV